jgi:hypothetical protein
MKKPPLLLLLLLAACERAAPPAPPPAPAPAPAASSAPVVVADAAPHDPAADFEPVVGEWRTEERGFAVDGTKWREGTPSANLADQAKRLYGDRYAEFLDGVKAYAFYPLALRRDPPPEGDLRLEVRFLPLEGKIDQAAGIAFGAAPDGSYWGVRANALEDNILFFKVVRGKRTVLDTIRNIPTPSKTWHTLALEIRGKEITVHLDGAKRFVKTLGPEGASRPAGRVGLWSKADSHVVFGELVITKL